MKLEEIEQRLLNKEIVTLDSSEAGELFPKVDCPLVTTFDKIYAWCKKHFVLVNYSVITGQYTLRMEG